MGCGWVRGGFSGCFDELPGLAFAVLGVPCFCMHVFMGFKPINTLALICVDAWFGRGFYPLYSLCIHLVGSMIVPSMVLCISLCRGV